MKKIIFALPKGRILDEIRPILNFLDIKISPEFYDENSRQLKFTTSRDDLEFIRIRSFDVATFVAFGAAQMGIAGNDVLMEFDYPDIYSPIDLKLGKCRLSVAAPNKQSVETDFSKASHLRIATKYPNVTKKYFAEKGIQAECIKLSGAMELAPTLNLSTYIVDLVSSGRTLKENGLKEVETIAEISSRLIVNRAAFKTNNKKISQLMEDFSKALKKVKK